MKIMRIYQAYLSFLQLGSVATLIFKSFRDAGQDFFLICNHFYYRS